MMFVKLSSVIYSGILLVAAMLFSIFPLDEGTSKPIRKITEKQLKTIYKQDSLIATRKADSLIESIEESCKLLKAQQALLKKQQEDLLRIAKNKADEQR